jgi:hypothetical protein
MSKIKVTATVGICGHFNARPATKRYNIDINVYALHIIARYAVNKHHSLGMITEK